MTYINRVSRVRGWVDAGGTQGNIEKIAVLAGDATILYIVTAFLLEDEARARGTA